MHEVSITGLTRIARPQPNKGGTIVLAFFDCNANGLALHGCAFVRTARRGLTVWPPKLDGIEASRRSVSIADEQLRSVMVRQAQASYRALGGTDGEWMSHDPDDDVRRATNFEAASRRIREKQGLHEEPGEEDGGLHRVLSNGAE